MSFEPVVGARTIAESLLHLAAVEYIFATALLVRQGRGDVVDPSLWEGLKAGLATELHYDPPAGVSREDCTAALAAVRALLEQALELEPDATLATEDDLRAGLEHLRDRGADLADGRVRALLPKLHSHLGEGSVGLALTAHEEYHRGQVLYQNFLWTRMAEVA